MEDHMDVDSPPAETDLVGKDGESDDDDASLPHEPYTPSEKHKAQNALFREWMFTTARAQVIEQVKKDTANAVDEELSIRELLNRKESTPIITSPREYQIELFERAKVRNTIAVLDTGTGKTLIAVLLLRHVIDQELEDCRAGRTSRTAFFLVPSVNLVFQQFAVLECNLDHSVGHVYGAIGSDTWKYEKWQKKLDDNKVIVCTPEVLYQALFHAFIKIEQINLLIFDEAHHAKKDHVYSKIMREYYAHASKESRPKVFGMTASPVDAKVDVNKAASDLENLLHSRIATTSDMTLLQKSVNKPHEKILRYPCLQQSTGTPLCRDLEAKYSELGSLSTVFTDAKIISQILGHWCADLFWTMALPEKIAQKAESRIERAYYKQKSVVDPKKRDAQIALMQEALSTIHTQDARPPSLAVPDLSSKVLYLRQYLSEQFDRPSDHMCIVFVEQRYTARLLYELFSRIGGPHLRPGFLVGSGNESGSLVDLRATSRQQILTVTNFRKGKLNCLFATSVAEEGLDIPDCNLVVRFDVCSTMIKYVQSRGRARHKNSTLIHMVEMGNSIHETLVRENGKAELTMKRFCEALPADRRLSGNDDEGDVPATDSQFRPYKIPSTGAQITQANCLGLLEHFVSALPASRDEEVQATYVTIPRAGQFQCEIIMPACSPFRGMLGDVKQRKSLARRSAAFKVCVELRKGGYLDANLLPIYTKKQLPALNNAEIGIDPKRKGHHTMRLKPNIWRESRGTVPTELFGTVIDLSDGLDRPHQPLLLLSRVLLPQFPSFPLYLKSGRQSFVQTHPILEPLQTSDGTVANLTSFTLRIFKDLFNKSFENDPAKMSYWLAPVDFNALSPLSSQLSVSDLIDWKCLEQICVHESFRWTSDMDPEFLLDKFLVDPWDGGKRFFVKRLAPEHKPLDAVPPDTVSNGRKDNILDYTVSLFISSRQKAVWNHDQPVIEAEKMMHRRNLLAQAESKEKSLRTKCFLCPEPLKISALPPSIVTTCYVFPAIIHRIDSYLMAKDVCTDLGLTLDIGLALEAITKDSDNSDDHRTQEKIRFQSGMGNNYERLEFLGDTFLKMATCIAVFIRNPSVLENELHIKKMLMLCNENLYNQAMDMKLFEYIRSQAFSRRTWYPEGIKLLEGKGIFNADNDVIKHHLGDKTLADVCEALMGAAYLTHNRNGAWTPGSWQNAVAAVTKLVANEEHDMMEWTDYSKAYEIQAYQTAEPTASQLDLAQKVELEHPYGFRYPPLLRSAFLHPSMPSSWEKVPSYERLEVLGDALLDMACVNHLVYSYPNKDPQWLTEHKMSMVSNRFFAALCVKLGFYRHLRYYGGITEYQLREYVTEIQEAERISKGAKDYWTTVKNPPKCLADMVESYVGAMFIDSDFNYGEVQKFFDMHIKPYFEDMTIYDSFANNHPMIHLHEILTQLGCIEYRLMADEMTIGDGSNKMTVAGLMIHDKIIARAHGKSTRYSKMRAAHAAAEELEHLPRDMYRSRFGCNCNMEEESGLEQTVDTAI